MLLLNYKGRLDKGRGRGVRRGAWTALIAREPQPHPISSTLSPSCRSARSMRVSSFLS